MKMFYNFLKHDKGAVLIEMTVVTPFLFLLAFGIFEFGNALYKHHVITTGIRDAARYLARYPGPDPDDLCVGKPTAGEAAARQIAVRGTPDGSGDLRVSWWDVLDAGGNQTIDIDYDTFDNRVDPVSGVRPYSDCDDIHTIRVTTSVDFQYVGLGFFNSLLPTLNFSMSHEERYIRR